MTSTLRVQLQHRIVSDDETVIRDEVILQFDRSGDRLEVIGLCMKDSKDLLGRLQYAVAEAQAAAYVNRHRCCSACGRSLRGKGQYPIVFRTAFGHVPLASPRFYRCRCHPADSRTFSPLADLFTEHTAPELLYLETRWASLISFGMTTASLRDVLPVAGTTNPETVRQPLHKVAVRHDADLGTGQSDLMDDGPAAGQQPPMLREAVIVGIDGGYLRNWHDKQKKFEVIVGKSIAEDCDDRYFGFVRSQNAAPERRFCEVLRRQGLPTDQPVTVLTDGGDSVRALTGNLPSGSEHVLDWFHVAMRMTVLRQYGKGLAHYNPLEATALQDRLERIKWRLWHGDAGEALSRARELAGDVAALSSGYPGLARLVQGDGWVGHLHREQRCRAHGLQRALGSWRNHLDRLCRIHRRPHRQPALCQKAADAVVEERGPPPPADPNLHPRWHAPRPVHHLVSGHARQRCPARPIGCRSLSCPTVTGALLH
jgi:hypothetical protein